MNNFKVGYTEVYNYYNFSDRVDYNINDKWKVYGRIGRYYTDDLAPNATPNKSKLFVPTGTSRGATQISGDGIWTANPRTVVNFHGDWHKVIDAYVSDSAGIRRMGRDLAQQYLVQVLPGRQPRRAGLLPELQSSAASDSAAADSTGTRSPREWHTTPRSRSSAARTS